MLQLATRRLLDAIPTLIGVTVISFVLLQATAGNLAPGGLVVGQGVEEADVDRIRHYLGLDLPWWMQYLNWSGLAWLLQYVGLGSIFGSAPITTGVLEGDLGRSLTDGTPATAELAARLPYTLELSGTAILVGTLLAVLLGVAAATHQYSRFDRGLIMTTALFQAVPSFWLGLLMILFFSITLRSWGLPWLPSGGAYSIGEGDLLDRATHLIMPASVLAAGHALGWARFIRSSVLDTLSQDFVRTARAKGMHESRVLYVHVFRNAMLPFLTLLGLSLPTLFSGAALIEVIFSWPGIGRFIVQSVQSHDYIAAMSTTLLGAGILIASNLLADVLVAVADPRVRARLRA